MILSLVLLVGLIPAMAIPASAASNAVSDEAITVLKKLEKFSAHCDENGFIGYGTKCTEKGPHGFISAHKFFNCDANRNARIRANFPDINKDNIADIVADGTTSVVLKNVPADLKNALKNAVESAVSSTDFSAVAKDAREAWLKTNERDLYDELVAAGKLDEVLDYDAWTALRKGTGKCPFDSHHGNYAHSIREKEADAALREALKTLDTAINSFASNNGISLTKGQHDALVLFSYDNGTAWTKGSDDLKTAVVNGTTGQAFVNVMLNWNSSDNNDRRKVECNMYLNGKYDSNAAALKVETKTEESSSDDLVTKDRVKVTVTNDYINVREKASIYSSKVGTVYKGDVLRITSTTNANGYLWGLYVDAGYNKVGYVALMYTNYDELIAADKYEKEQIDANTPKTMGTAVVSVNGYVNVRSGPGTSNPIVSSLRDGTTVDLYEIQYVNGQRWGRTNVGWFSLAYAKNVVITDSSKDNTNDYGYVNYLFTGTLKAGAVRYAEDNGNPDTTGESYTESDKRDVKIGRVVSYNGETWGKSSEGWKKPWFKLDESFELDSATYTTITEVSVREKAGSSESRVQTLEKGTEFDITRIAVKEDTVWGYAEADGDVKYNGWINLATKYVTRKGAQLKDETKESEKCTLATAKVDVNIRKKASIFGEKVGTLPSGTTVRVLEGPVNGTRTTGWYRLKFSNRKGTDSWARGDNLKIFEGTTADITYGKTPTSPDGTKAATGKGMVANTYGGVNVRTAPGTANKQVTKLLPGTVVNILEVTNYGTTKWGRIEQGWVCMDYIAMMDYDDLNDSSSSTVTSSTQAVYTGSVSGEVEVYKDTKKIDTNKVRTLDSGDAITIYELLTVKEVTKDDENVTETTKYYWARVNDGYILLSEDVEKIALDPLDEAVYTVTETDLLKVREKAGTSADREDLDLKKGDQVKVTNVRIVSGQFWGQIEHKDLSDGEGWICLSYCTKGAVSVTTNETTANTGSGSTTTNTVPTTMSIGNTGKGTYSGKIIGSAQVTEVNVRKEPSTSSAEVTKLKKGTAITITETRLVDGRSWGYCGSGWINLLYVDLTPVGITAIDAKVIAVDNTLVYESSETGAKVVGSYANRAVVNIYEEMNGMYKTDMGWISKGNCL